MYGRIPEKTSTAPCDDMIHVMQYFSLTPSMDLTIKTQIMTQKTPPKMPLNKNTYYEHKIKNKINLMMMNDTGL